MSKEQLDLIHYQNKTRQLQQLLEAEQEKVKKLKRILAEVSFTGKSLIKRLESV
jgi:hypothetical protein